LQRAFHVWDRDRDERVDLEDLAMLAQKRSVRLSPQELKAMFEHAIVSFNAGHDVPKGPAASAAGSGAAAGAPSMPAAPNSGLADFSPPNQRLALGHVVHALGYRRVQPPLVAEGSSNAGRSRSSALSKTMGSGAKRKGWEPQPHQRAWLLLIEATLPGEPILAQPQTPPSKLFAAPIQSYRERTGAGPEGLPSATTASGRARTAPSPSLGSGLTFDGFSSATGWSWANESVEPNVTGNKNGTKAAASSSAGAAPWRARRQTFSSHTQGLALSAAVLARRPRSRAHGALPEPQADDFHGTRGLAWSAVEAAASGGNTTGITTSGAGNGAGIGVSNSGKDCSSNGNVVQEYLRATEAQAVAAATAQATSSRDPYTNGVAAPLREAEAVAGVDAPQGARSGPEEAIMFSNEGTPMSGASTNPGFDDDKTNCSNDSGGRGDGNCEGDTSVPPTSPFAGKGEGRGNSSPVNVHSFAVVSMMSTLTDRLDETSQFARRTAAMSHEKAKVPTNAAARFAAATEASSSPHEGGVQGNSNSSGRSNMLSPKALSPSGQVPKGFKLAGSPAQIDAASRALFSREKGPQISLDGMWSGGNAGGDSQQGDDDASHFTGPGIQPCALPKEGPFAPVYSAKASKPDDNWQRSFFQLRTNEEWRRSVVSV